MGAVQGQDYAGAKWSIGLRLNGIKDSDVEQALKNKTIVRTWALRGTLHFVSASDIHWLLATISPRIISKNTRRYQELKLDKKTLSHSNKILRNALNNDNQLTRSELLKILNQKGISTEGQRGYYILQRASIEGFICQGVTQFNDPTFMSLEGFPEDKIDNEAALAELAKRYFHSHGPGTLKDFIWWSGLFAKDARAGLDAIKSKLKKEVIDGVTYWMSSIMYNQLDSPKINLLPGFDEYLLSYKDRSASIDTEQIKKMLTPTNGFFRPTIIINGRVKGTWKRIIKRGKVIIELNPFMPLNDDESEILALEVHRFGEFLGMDIAEIR
ncbi:MAG: winged helix DNA-binding domain-containing protein [Methanobacterium sp.]